MKRAVRLLLCFTLCFIIMLPLPAAWAEDEGMQIRVGVLDSGILANHNALNDIKIESGENLVFPNSSSKDLLGHGTRIAGLIAEQSKNVTLTPLVVVSRYPSGLQKSCNGQEIANAIIKAIDEYDCRVLNVSLGLIEDSAELRKAVEYAEEMGVVIVAAAGNSGKTDPDARFYPAAYSTVIAVGAVDDEGNPATFSQTGDDLIYAPGVDVPVISFGFSINPPKVSGTSYAAATVTGWLSEILHKNPDFSPAQIREALSQSNQTSF